MRQIGLLILLLGCGGDAQSGAPAAAEAELVREAVESLDAAFKSGDRGAGTRAIVEAREVLAGDEAVRVFRELGERGTAEVGIELMRWMEHPGVVDVLHRAYRSMAGMLDGDPELCALLLRSIGQHGEASSVAILGDPASHSADARVLRARMWGLARVGTVPALDALFGLLDRIETLDEARRKAAMADFRVAALVLTGADAGDEPTAWRAWRAEQELLRVPEAAPELPAELAGAWESYWTRPTSAQRSPEGSSGSAESSLKQ